MDIVVADPAGNITVFVLEPVKEGERRLALARSILADPALKAEQVGFVIPPGTTGGLWRLQMMGGEFCGNAARSFGLFVACEQGLKGKVSIMIEISGAAGPIGVEADVDKGIAWASMPLPLARESLVYKGKELPVLVFEGIVHIIAPALEASNLETAKKVFGEIKGLYEREHARPPAALGVMFFDEKAVCIKPAGYVYGTGSLVFESSCGSGSAALGCRLADNARDGETEYAVAQSGGLIRVRVRKEADKVTGLAIGGEVKLGEKLRYDTAGYTTS
jgi:diaminopimelate epimerase